MERGEIMGLAVVVYKIFVTVLIGLMISIVGWFMWQSRLSGASMVGFSLMELVYVMSVVGIWI